MVRHARTADQGKNGRARLTGWTDTALSREGGEQANQLAMRLLGEGTFTSVYSSPLQRALETAEPIATALGLTSLVNDGLREINCGILDGAEVEVVEQRFPAIWAANLAQQNAAFRWPGGESYLEFRARCVATLAAIAEKHRGGRVIVVTHAGVINQILGHLQGITPARWEPFRPNNASVTEVEWLNGTGRLVQFDVKRVSDTHEQGVEITLGARRLDG